MKTLRVGMSIYFEVTVAAETEDEAYEKAMDRIFDSPEIYMKYVPEWEMEKLEEVPNE